MELTTREFWALIHGIVLGGVFLVAFTGGLAGFYSLRPEYVTEAGIAERTRRLVLGTGVMAALTWLIVIVGTWVVYPWYREDTPESPRSQLLASPDTEDWHTFAMEWKEHVAWIAPMLATAAFVVAAYYGRDLIRYPAARRIAMTLFIAAFGIAAIAGVLGALITKKVPVT